LFQFAIARLYDLSVAALGNKDLQPEAQKLQGIIARADFTTAKAGVAGTKFILEKLYGYGGSPRKPLLPADPVSAESLWQHPHVVDLIQVERELSGKSLST